MTWQDRLKEAAYTAPSGTRQTFAFEDVRRQFNKKTTGFEFPDSNQTYVQDNGRTDFKFPLRLFFSGPDHDLEAEAFEGLLSERGVGRLEHPMYGASDVVPFGTITRRDDLATAANQTVIEVTFWKSTRTAFPTTQQDPASEVSQAVDEFNQAVAGAFSGGVSLDNSVEQTTFKNSYLKTLDAAASALRPVAETLDSVDAQFNAIVDSINIGIDTLVGDPLTLALQTTQLIQAPAIALANVQTKLTVYASLANSIIGADTPTSENGLQNAKLYANLYVSGAVLSVLNGQFDTKPQALSAAEQVLTLFSDVSKWIEDGYLTIGALDTGAEYQQLQEAVALAAGFLVELSFDLREERRLVLTRNRTIIDLVAELYGSVDDQLDFFIVSNNLTPSEILELPQGREVVYYV